MKIKNLLFIILILTSNSAHAFKFSPMQTKFTPYGNESNKLFYVENDSDQRVAVQMSLENYDMDENGTEINSTTDEFVIYPEQIILEPKTKRGVRVQWVGAQDLAIEKTYRIIAEQLPVDLDKNANQISGVKFLINYRGLIYVTPPGSNPDIKLTFKFDDKNNSLELICENKGEKSVRLHDMTLSLIYENGTISKLSTRNSQIESISKELILANHKRRFQISKLLKLNSKIRNIKLSFNENYQ